jgi:hypothetical protein
MSTLRTMHYDGSDGSFHSWICRFFNGREIHIVFSSCESFLFDCLVGPLSASLRAPESVDAEMPCELKTYVDVAYWSPKIHYRTGIVRARHRSLHRAVVARCKKKRSRKIRVRPCFCGCLPVCLGWMGH